MTTSVYELDGHRIEIGHADKVLFPDDDITKGDLVDYYARIAPVALPHYRGRPVTLRRFPDGIAAEGFFQKNAPDYFPDWIERAEIAKEGGTVRHMLARSAAALVYIAGQGCITPHLGVAKADRPDRPDRLVFDLDPSDDDFGKVQEVARAVGAALDELEIPKFVQTTGSRGLHIVVPIKPTANFEPLRRVMRAFAERIAEAHPKLATAAQRKAERGDRVLVDTFRTAYGQTYAAPYAVRARPAAPVATPLRWPEALASDMSPRKYGLKSIFRRLGQTEDPWRDMDAAAIDPQALISALLR